MKRHLIGMILALSSVVFVTGCVPAIIAGTATGASVAIDRRSTGAVVDDQTIELKAMQLLSKQSFFDQSHVTITSYNGRVLLVGQVPNTTDAQKLVHAISKVPKAKQAFNELEIGAPISLSTRSNDTVITGKVKSQLLTLKGFDSHAVKVITENSIVYLMGIVTYDEAHKATEEARKVNGVRKVVRVFEYINKKP